MLPVMLLKSLVGFNVCVDPTHQEDVCSGGDPGGKKRFMQVQEGI